LPMTFGTTRYGNVRTSPSASYRTFIARAMATGFTHGPYRRVDPSARVTTTVPPRLHRWYGDDGGNTAGKVWTAAASAPGSSDALK
jgi:hypothetical protein